MIFDNNNDELIERYLEGELRGNALREFEQKLAVDADFKREVNLHNTMIDHLRLAGRQALRQELKGFHVELVNETQETRAASIHAEKSPGRIVKFWPFRLAAAASLVLVVGCTLLYFLMRNQMGIAEAVFDNYYTPYPNVAYVTTRAPEGKLSATEEAFRAYDSGNYAKSIPLFKSVSDGNEVALFYLGNAYLSNKQPAEAVQVFTRYLATDKQFGPEAEWYLALSYLRANRPVEARKHLNRLVKGNDDYRDKARRALKELD